MQGQFPRPNAVLKEGLPVAFLGEILVLRRTRKVRLQTRDRMPRSYCMKAIRLSLSRLEVGCLTLFREETEIRYTPVNCF